MTAFDFHIMYWSSDVCSSDRPEATIINADLNVVSLDALMKQCGIKAGELDLLFGGPPCQTFSQIGKQGSLRDARGKLLFSMVEYARKLKPRAILIENVKAQIGRASCRDRECQYV